MDFKSTWLTILNFCLLQTNVNTKIKHYKTTNPYVPGAVVLGLTEQS